MRRRLVARSRGGGRPDRRAGTAVGARPGRPGRAGLPGHGDSSRAPMSARWATSTRRLRIAFTAGHCRGNGTVRDKDGNFVGNQALFRDNTPDGATDRHQPPDRRLGGDQPGPRCCGQQHPAGRTAAGLRSQASCRAPGLPVCHFGVITGESCGTIQAVNNGWFTMANGVVSQKGDSGGPVYVLTPDGRAAIIGMFNSTWGQYPAAVSWQVASQQASEDVISAASGSVDRSGASALADAARTPGSTGRRHAFRRRSTAASTRRRGP